MKEVRIKISYCYDEIFDEWQALLIPQIPCEEGTWDIIPVLRDKNTGFFGEYLHRRWGRLSEDGKHRERSAILYAKSLEELKEKIERRINEETQKLIKVIQKSH